MKRIGIVLFDQVEELDVVGPWEVLANWTQSHPDDGWEVLCISETGRPVTGAKGLQLGAHRSFDEAGSLDVVIIPGGIGTRPLMKDEAFLGRVRTWKDAAEVTASVCTGSLVLAAARVLSGRSATTYWAATDLLAETDPLIVVRPEERFVDEGDVITSAGVSAGIDMALHLVSRLAGRDRAVAVRRYIQYDPEPPV